MNYYNVVHKIHTKHAGCLYKIKWNVKEISKEDSANGYIVQRFKRYATPANIIQKDEEYYEAWKVLNGKVCSNDGKDYKYDDVYRIYITDENALGASEELLESAIASIDTKGRFDFEGDVYWISNHDDLYSIVDGWGTEIAHAGNLQSSYEFLELKEREPLFTRSFVHCWNFIEEETIVPEVLTLLCKAFPNDRVREERIQKSISSIKNDRIRAKLQEHFQKII